MRLQPLLLDLIDLRSRCTPGLGFLNTLRQALSSDGRSSVCRVSIRLLQHGDFQCLPDEFVVEYIDRAGDELSALRVRTSDEKHAMPKKI